MAEDIDFDTYEKSIDALRNAYPKYRDYRHPGGLSSVDKRGIGFNKDSRFSHASLTISFDSWIGYYGDSSCVRAVLIGDENLFKEALVRYLNDHAEEILNEMADGLERRSVKAKAEKIAMLEAELHRLKGDSDGER